MTGKEILEEEFEKAGMRGYKADQVDEFLRKIAEYVDEINKEKEDLTYKIQILADKIEEYKADEENIREALLGAQKLGASMLNEAKAKAEAMTRESKSASEEMLAQARAKVDSLTKDSLQKANSELSSIKRECDMEQRHLESIKKEVSSFKATILKQYKAQLTLLSNLPSAEERSVAVERIDNRVETITEPVYSEPAHDEEIVSPVIEEEKPAPSIRMEIQSIEEVEEAPVPQVQTIKSGIVSIDDEIEKEEREQTKEFGSERKSMEKENEKNAEKEESASSFGRRNQRPNYIEKFGELKFGGFGENDK